MYYSVNQCVAKTSSHTVWYTAPAVPVFSSGYIQVEDSTRQRQLEAVDLFLETARAHLKTLTTSTGGGGRGGGGGGGGGGGTGETPSSDHTD